jgi:hypothetical protein
MFDAKRIPPAFFNWLCLALNGFPRPEIGFKMGLIGFIWVHLGSFFIIKIAISHR